MSTGWKKAGGVIVLIISMIVLLVSIGGAVGLWIVKGQVEDVTSAVFSPVESALETTTRTLDKVNARVDTARSRVSNAQEFVGQLGQSPVGNGAVLSAISDTVETKLGPQIDAAQEAVGNALDLVAGVNNAIVRLNTIPGVNLPTLTDELQSLRTTMTSLQDRVTSFRTDLQSAIAGRLQLTAARINQVLSDIDGGLQNIQSTVGTKTENVQQTQARLATLKDDIFSWITISWIVGTVFLVWIAISQVVMLRYGWSLVAGRPRDLTQPPASTPSNELTAVGV